VTIAIVALSISFLTSCYLFAEWIIERRKSARAEAVNRLLIEMSSEIAKLTDIDELYSRILSYTMRIIQGAQWGSVLVYDPEKGGCVFKALVGYDPKELESLVLKKETLWLYTTNKLSAPAVIVNPAILGKDRLKSQQREILRNSKTLDHKAALSAPINVDGKFFGCLTLDNLDRVDAFSKKDIAVISYVCDYLAMVIKNMLLIDEVKGHLVTDPLTGLFNRRYFSALLEGRCPEAISSDGVCLMIDLDDFKQINDLQGHAMGDEVLRHFSEQMRSRFRKRDRIIRYAGDEFVIILEDCPADRAEGIIEEMRADLCREAYKGLRIRFSYGLSLFGDGKSLETAIAEADEAMYAAKRRGKEC